MDTSTCFRERSSMRELVRVVVANSGVSDRQKAFHKVFQRLSSSRNNVCALDTEQLLYDRIESGLSADTQSLDAHLRFNSLCKRMRALTLRPELRFAIMRMLYGLRGPDADSSVQLGIDKIFMKQVSSSIPRSPVATSSETVPSLGWLANPTGGPSTGLPESLLLRDLLHALHGVESSCFVFHKQEGKFEINASFVLLRPARLITQRILELGSLHARLCAVTNSALECESGQSLLHQALCEVLREHLREYYKILALLLAKVGSSLSEGAELTVRRLWIWLQAPFERMVLLHAVCHACLPLRGGALASAVYGFSRSGDVASHDACVTILKRVVGPLLAMIRVWMTEGELRDPCGEFFVCAASVPLEDLWTRMYSLEIEMVPCFITVELARKILLTGKSVNFIRLCCPGQDWLPRSSSLSLALPGDPAQADDTVSLGESSSLPLADLSDRVEHAALQTNRHLVSLMMNQYALGEHCLALRRFLLLGQGDFVESLIDLAKPELCKDTKEVHRHQLMGIVDMAIRQSNAQFLHADTIARVGVKLLKPSSGEKGWDVFLLEYAIDSPLHVVFTSAAMGQYDRAFAFLWKLRRVTHSLSSCWSQNMALHRHVVSCKKMAVESPELGLEMRQTLHKSTCLRNEIHHFVHTVHSYVMCEVLETSWAKLQLGWSACTDLDQVILEHQRYLTCIEEGAFLATKTEPILTALSALFVLALEFTELHDHVCASAFEAVDVLNREDGVPYARSLAECRYQLDRIGATFLLRLQALLKALEGQASRLSSDLRFLLCRLDFNGFYERTK